MLKSAIYIAIGVVFLSMVFWIIKKRQTENATGTPGKTFSLDQLFSLYTNEEPTAPAPVNETAPVEGPIN